MDVFHHYPSRLQRQIPPGQNAIICLDAYSTISTLVLMHNLLHSYCPQRQPSVHLWALPELSDFSVVPEPNIGTCALLSPLNQMLMTQLFLFTLNTTLLGIHSRNSTLHCDYGVSISLQSDLYQPMH